jgi:hypothetical protein
VPSLSGTLATVQVAAADATASAITNRLDHQGAYYTDVVVRIGGCLQASVTLFVDRTPPISAAISCNPFGTAP